jgi:hypothetical protein
MSTGLPPSGRTRGSVTETQTSAFSVPKQSTMGRRQTFSGRFRRVSESDAGRKTPSTGIRGVNIIMNEFNLQMGNASAGRRGLIVANTQSQLESMIEEMRRKLEMERKTLNNMETKPKTANRNVNKQEKIIKTLENKVREYENAVQTVLRKGGPIIITNKPPAETTRPEPRKSSGGTNASKKQNKVTQTKSSKKTNQITQTNSSNNNENTPKNNENPSTPTKQPIKQTNKPPSIKDKHGESKKQGANERTEERRKRWEREGSPAVRRALEPIFNKMAKSPKTPPGITKSNLQQFLAPFKQPISIQFAPSIKATGGNATVTQIKTNKDDKKKKTPKKFNILADPASAYRKSVVASKRKEIMSKLRTPTVGQRKKHVIQLIDKELRLMKVPKDIERKIISLYSKVLSEKQIKQLFGGRSAGDVKKILKKQVDYFKKKKR